MFKMGRSRNWSESVGYEISGNLLINRFIEIAHFSKV